jgi:hypothetical protein
LAVGVAAVATQALYKSLGAAAVEGSERYRWAVEVE